MISTKKWCYKPYVQWGPLKLDSQIERWDLEDIFGAPTSELRGHLEESIYLFNTVEGPIKAIFSSSLSFQCLALSNNSLQADEPISDAAAYEVEFHHGHHQVFPNLGLSLDLNSKELCLYAENWKNLLYPSKPVELKPPLNSTEFEASWRKIKRKWHVTGLQSLQPILSKESVQSLTNPRIGGVPLLKKDEEWPCCGLCQSPLACIFQLSSDEMPASHKKYFSPQKLFQLFHCLNEDCHDFDGEPEEETRAAFICRIESISEFKEPDIKTVEKNRKYILNQHALSGWSVVSDGPSITELLMSTDNEIKSVAEKIEFQLAYSESLPDQNDKIGGGPAFIQDITFPTCAYCKSRSVKTKFIMQFNSRQNDDAQEWIFGDAGCAYIFRCTQNAKHFTLILQTS